MESEQYQAITTSGAVLGQVLVVLRKKHELTQTDIASKVGISPSTWSRIEKGEVALSIEQLRAAAHELKMKPGDIIALAEYVESCLDSKKISIDNKSSVKNILSSVQAQANNADVKDSKRRVSHLESSTSLDSCASRVVYPIFGVALGMLVAGAVVSYLRKNDK